MEGMDGMEGEGDMENEGDAMEEDAMDGDMDNAEGNEADAMEGEEGMDEMGGEEATLAQDASVADLGTEGNADSPKKTNVKKKKTGSPPKKGKKKDPNEIKLVEYKKSDKTKRWIVSEKLKIPEDIEEYIK